MSETIEKAQERERILYEGHELFAKQKLRFFKELFDILPNWEELKISDFCRIGFGQGYLEGYRKAKGEAQPETKAGNPMPEILPGYLIKVSGCFGAVVRNDKRGLIVFLGGTAAEIPQSQIEEIMNENQNRIWRKD